MIEQAEWVAGIRLTDDDLSAVRPGMTAVATIANTTAIGAVMVARAISIYGCLSFIGLFQSKPVDLRCQTVMVWGGLRGAVALALALSIPVTLDYWWTIQSVVFGVVLFTLFVQAPTIGLLVDKLDIRGKSK